MKALSGRSFRIRLERVIGPVVALVMVGATVSSALAADLPGAAGNNQSLSPSHVAQCEALLAQAAPDRQSATAPLAGLALLRSDAGRFDLWRPATWRVMDLSDFLVDSVLLTPDGQNQGAHFSIQVMDTLNDTTVDDLQWRSEWFNNLINALPYAQVQWQARWTDGNVTSFEARYTYRDSNIGTTTTRWVRLLYVGTQQYWLVAQAPSTAEFSSLEPMFLAMMVTFRLDDQAAQAPVAMCVA